MAELKRVVANVSVVPASREQEGREAIRQNMERDQHDPRFQEMRAALERALAAPPSPSFDVSLSAQLDDGCLIGSVHDRADFVVGGALEGRVDLEQQIKTMLGHERHRPPRLSWEYLIEALRRNGFAVSEDDLIRTPLTIELSPEVLNELR